jgi:putative SOS response-associated peptidase YedK
MTPIHNRMPVILSLDDEQAWISPDTSSEQALEILNRPLPADAMEAYAVSTSARKSIVSRFGGCILL